MTVRHRPPAGWVAAAQAGRSTVISAMPTSRPGFDRVGAERVVQQPGGGLRDLDLGALEDRLVALDLERVQRATVELEEEGALDGDLAVDGDVAVDAGDARVDVEVLQLRRWCRRRSARGPELTCWSWPMTYGETVPGSKTVTLPPVIGKLSSAPSRVASPTVPGVQLQLGQGVEEALVEGDLGVLAGEGLDDRDRLGRAPRRPRSCVAAAAASGVVLGAAGADRQGDQRGRRRCLRRRDGRGGCGGAWVLVVERMGALPVCVGCFASDDRGSRGPAPSGWVAGGGPGDPAIHPGGPRRRPLRGCRAAPARARSPGRAP